MSLWHPLVAPADRKPDQPAGLAVVWRSAAATDPRGVAVERRRPDAEMDEFLHKGAVAVCHWEGPEAECDLCR
jgi:hypothetical protein